MHQPFNGNLDSLAAEVHHGGVHHVVVLLGPAALDVDPGPAPALLRGLDPAFLSSDPERYYTTVRDAFFSPLPKRRPSPRPGNAAHHLVALLQDKGILRRVYTQNHGGGVTLDAGRHTIKPSRAAFIQGRSDVARCPNGCRRPLPPRTRSGGCDAEGENTGVSRVGGSSCDVPAQETPRETGEAAAVRETGDAGRETGLVGRAWLGPAAAAVLATGTGLTGRSALGRAKSGMAGQRAAAATGTGGVGRTPGAAWHGPADGVGDGGDETKGYVVGRGGDGTARAGGVVRIGGSSSVVGASSSMQAGGEGLRETGGETAAQLSKQSPAVAVVPPAIRTVPVSCSGERLRRRIADGRIPRCDLCFSPLRLDLLLPGEACRTDVPPPGDTALLSPEDTFTAMHKEDVEVNGCVCRGGMCVHVH